MRRSAIIAGCCVVAWNVWATDGGRGDEPLHKAREALRDGFPELAEKYLARRLAARAELAPAARAETLLWLARAQLAGRRMAESAATLDAAALVDAPPDLAARLDVERARLAWLSGDPTNALARLAEVAPAALPETERPRLLRLRARALRDAGRTDAAIAALLEFDETHPGDPDAAENLFDLAAAQMAAGRPDAARLALEKLLREHPADPLADRARLTLADMPAVSPEEARAALAPLLASDQADANLRAEAGWRLARRLADAGQTAAALEQAARAERDAGAGALAATIRIFRAWTMIRAGQTADGLPLLRETLRTLKDPSRAAAEQLALARHFAAQGAPAAAAQEYQVFIESFPEHPDLPAAQIGRADSLMELGRALEAETLLGKIAERTDASPALRAEALFKAADAAWRAGEYGRALARYDRFIADYPALPETPRAVFQSALCLRQLDRMAEAHTALERLQTFWPDHALVGPAALQRAQWLDDLGRFDEARRLYDERLSVATNTADRAAARLARGLSAYRAGRYGDALEDLRWVAAQTPAGDAAAAQADLLQGWALYLLGREAEAERHMREYPARRPDSAWAPDALFWLGEHAYNRADYETAQTNFLQLAAGFPAHRLADRALFWAGRAALADRRYTRALEIFGQLARQYPQSPHGAEARFAQGDAMSELGEFAGAILAFDEVARDQPDSYLADLAWGRKGDCHFTLADEDPARFEQALGCYQRVLASPKAGPELTLQAEYKIGRCLERMNRPREAFERYMNVVYAYLENRGVGAVWFTRAALAAAALKEREGAWAEAVRVYRRLEEAGGPAAADAREKIQRIRREQWMGM